MEERKSTPQNGHGISEMSATSKETRKKMTFRRTLPQVLAVSAKNILLLAYGLTLGFPTIVIPSVTSVSSTLNSTNMSSKDEAMSDFLQLTLEEVSWFSSINLLCVPVGCFLSGLVTQPFGRKKSMLFLNLPFIASWLLFNYSTTLWMLYLALCLTGLTGGLLEAPVITYVAEITEPEVRGVLSAVSSLCVILGVFLQFLMGSMLHWRKVALINIAFPVSAIIGISFVPESPHWLIGVGRFEEAKKALMWLRGWVKPEEVESELAQLKRDLAESKESGKKDTAYNWKEIDLKKYLKPSFLKPFWVVTLAFMAGHFGGMTTLQTFAVSIFAAVGSPLDKYVSTVLLGLVELLGAAACACLVRWSGKRPLALASTLGASLAFLIVGFTAGASSSGLIKQISWIPLVGLSAGAFLSHLCLRLLPWMLIGEVFTPDVRHMATGISAGMGYILGFITNKSYLYIVQSVQVWGALVTYGLVGLAGFVGLYIFLPETEGLTLMEVQDVFKGKLTKRGKVETVRREKERWASVNPAMVGDAESHF